MQYLDIKQISGLYIQIIDDCGHDKHVLIRRCGNKNEKKTFNVFFNALNADAERTLDVELVRKE